jgi:hypothetical protein
MADIIPSYLAKLARAEKHLADLKDAIDVYGGVGTSSHPYTLRKRVEGYDKREVYRLHFTRSPANTEIPLIAADAIYNMRSSLEHLIAALAPASGRDKLTFPIFWRGVWEPDIEGEDMRRRKARHVWRAIDKALAPEAVAALKLLQPPDDAGPGEKDHDLRILNRLSNTDRHAKLPVAAGGVLTLNTLWRLRDGSEKIGLAAADPGHVVEDGAETKDVPPGAVYVECEGTPVVVIRLRDKDVASQRKSVNIMLPGGLEAVRGFIDREVVPRLLPYVRGEG